MKSDGQSWRVTHLKLPPRNRRSLHTDVLGDAVVGGESAAEGEGLITDRECRVPSGRTGSKMQAD